MAIKFKRGEIWYIKYKDENGTWRNISCGKSAKSIDAETIRKKYDSDELNRSSGIDLRPVEISLKDALEFFRKNILIKSKIGRDKAARAIRREQVCIENFVNWLDFSKNNYNFKSITETKIDEFFIADSCRGTPKSHATKRMEHRVLNNFFKWSIEHKYTDKNPFKKIPQFKKTKKHPRFFTQDELESIFKGSEEPYKSAFEFLYFTGLRSGELCNLQWTDIVFEQKIAVIRSIEGNKTKKDGTINLSEKTMAIINQRYSNMPMTVDGRIYVFTDENGKQLTRNRVYSYFMMVLKKTNISKANVHTFRHTCASHLVIKGVSLYVVKEILRHASIKETEIYAHLSKEPVQKALELL